MLRIMKRLRRGRRVKDVTFGLSCQLLGSSMVSLKLRIMMTKAAEEEYFSMKSEVKLVREFENFSVNTAKGDSNG